MAAPSLALLAHIVRSRGTLPIERAAEIVRNTLSRIGADAGFVGTPSDGGRAVHVLRATRDSSNFVKLAFPVDAPYPLATAMRLGVPLFISDNAQLACEHPGLVRIRSADHACATIPLFAEDGEVLGALNVTFEDPHPFTEEERRQIEALAAECAAELRR